MRWRMVVIMSVLLASPSTVAASETVIDDRWLTFRGDGVYSSPLSSSDAAGKQTRLAKNDREKGFRHPYPIAALDDVFVFALNDRPHGFELWRTDGTRRGTRLVADIGPGSKDSLSAGSTPAVRFGDRVLISLNDGKHGRELWVSDGTRRGTRLVKDIRPGRKGSGPHSFVENGDHAFFVAGDGTHGSELWVTDGTEAGTELLADMVAGPAPGGIATGPILNGRLLFSAKDGAGGRSAWSSDGTAAGTTRIPGFPVRDNSLSTCTLSVEGRELHLASNGRLWRTDGTRDGTAMVGGQFPWLENFACRDTGDGTLAWEDVAYLGLYNDEEEVGQLWRTDGTAAGTFALAEFSGNVNAYTGLVVDDKLLFAANDGDWRLWATDGSVQGTRLVRDIHPEATALFGFLGVVDGVAYLVADDGVHGGQLWAANGTPGGSIRLSDAEPRGFMEMRYLARVDDVVYFAARRHGRPGAATKSGALELWQTDGTPEGTRMVAGVN